MPWKDYFADPRLKTLISAALANNRDLRVAVESIERALQLEPAFTEAWGNRGLVLRDLKRTDDAITSFDVVLRLEPNNAVAFNSRGNVLRDKKDFEAAIESYSRAIELRPDYAEALINRGYTLWSLKRNDEGTADVERGLALDPDYPYGRGELLHVRMFCADWHDFDSRKAELEGLVLAGKKAVQPFNFQAVAQTPDVARACSRNWVKDRYPEMPVRPHDPATRRNAKKIRIGYLSGEFRQQATAVLMAGLYERHDREQFEIVALDAGYSDATPMRARLEKAFDRWINIASLSDQDADEVAGWLRSAHGLVAARLTGKLRRDLGIQHSQAHPGGGAR